MSAVVVRPVRPAEYEVVGELVVTAFTTLPGAYDLGRYADVLRDVAGRVAHGEVLVAVAPDAAAPRAGAGAGDSDDAADHLRVWGTVTFAIGGALAEVADPGEAAFRMLAVDPAARGRGIGEVLVRACVDRARAAGVPRIRLSTQPAMTAAHRLYERLGFVRTPDRDWEPEPGIVLLTYALDLP